ncbi:MAG: N-acetylmuramoyl-L-alanine amidase [bacterium]|nr:N-acetylmuramoyl-L-alanine amidase [bacterium]
MANLPLMEWLPGLRRLDAKFVGQPLTGDVDLIIVHSGALGAHVARYLHDPADDRYVSAHVSWDSWEGPPYQQVSLAHEAMHAGGSRFRGQGGLNGRSYGIELPGPASALERPDIQRVQLRAVVRLMCTAAPTITTITAHQWIDRRKRDPGPGVPAAWFDGLELEVVWRPCRD